VPVLTQPDDIAEAILTRGQAWKPAYEAYGQVRPGTWVAELTLILILPRLSLLQMS
jgi:hypothetical protein